MKAEDIRQGGIYLAKISNRIVRVRVDSIRQREGYRSPQTGKKVIQARTVYDVTNLDTGRTTTFDSPMKFRGPAPLKPKGKVVKVQGPTFAQQQAKAGEAITQLKEQTDHALEEGGLKKVSEVHDSAIWEGTPEQVEKVGKTFAERFPTLAAKAKAEGEKRADPPSASRESQAVDAASSGQTPPGNSPRQSGEGKQGSDPTQATSPHTKNEPLKKTSSGELSGNGAEGEDSSDPCPHCGGTGRIIQPAAIVTATAPARTSTPTSLVASVLASTRQAAEVRAKEDKAPHLVIVARAGTGKTTTLVEGLKGVMQMKTKFSPSPQQDIIWKAMKTGPQPRTVCFVAFNVTIADELKTRVPRGCDAMTMHSLGFRAVARSFNLNDKNLTNKYRVRDIMAELLRVSIYDLKGFQAPLVKATKAIVDLCKMNLVHEPAEGRTWLDEVSSLARYYDIELGDNRPEVARLVPLILERCKEVQKDGKMDYADMIWLPVVLNLPVHQYDLLLVDEAQDLNRCQQALARKAGRRLILCGDDRQAIYGFAGADAESLTRMGEELGKDPRGCQVLPLTVTRRCAKAIVQEAKRLVPDFEAFEGNPEGVVREMKYPLQKKRGSREKEEIPLNETYLVHVRAGDMILCRANSPLVSQCFKLLKLGHHVRIIGRNVGDGLLDLIDKLEASDLPDLIQKLTLWVKDELAKENAEASPSEARIMLIQDKHDCIRFFMDEVNTVQKLKDKINELFNVEDLGPETVRLSSIHKAKGLEAKRVFYIRGFGRPLEKMKNEWEVAQEYNLHYVAVTRAIEELTYVR